jgi:hypothetical protein
VWLNNYWGRKLVAVTAAVALTVFVLQFRSLLACVILVLLLSALTMAPYPRFRDTENTRQGYRLLLAILWFSCVGQFVYSFLPIGDPDITFASDWGVHYIAGWVRMAYEARVVPLLQQALVLAIFAFNFRHNVHKPPPLTRPMRVRAHAIGKDRCGEWGARCFA